MNQSAMDNFIEQISTLQECVELLTITLQEIEDAQVAEESYRWEFIGSYPNVKIPDEVRLKWLADLKVITDRQYEARKKAQELLKVLKNETC